MTTSTAARNAAPPSTRSGSLLRTALRLDAVVTGANGLAYLAAAPLLDDLLGLPGALLRGVGAFLLVYAVAVWLVGTGPRVNRAAVEAVVAANVLWAIGSVVAVVTGAGSPTTVGAVWLVLQAAVVAVLAALQITALRHR